MDLFDHARQEESHKRQPLAARIRPRRLDEFVGQEDIIGPGRLLRRAIEADQLSSIILWGPPGTGKTTIASIIANHTQSAFETINAVMAGVADIRRVVADAKERFKLYSQRTILMVDEIHRFNKAQQDALLPHVEDGTIILIGATTENPYFEVNPPLVSRSRVFQLHQLDDEQVTEILRRALADPERGLGRVPAVVDADALAHIVKVAGGDARTALNALELAVITTPASRTDKRVHVTLQVAEDSIQRRAILYDKDGDAHYDTISAFIKSVRGSDPDAALYWLAKMVYAGEDPRFILRRLIILAGEDIGLADPMGLVVATAAADAFERIGMPEGVYPLVEATLYLATAPKSNSAGAYFSALKLVQDEGKVQVPQHLQDASRDGAALGHGVGYQYPHEFEAHFIPQNYLPEAIKGTRFYRPSDQGYEAQVIERLERWRQAQLDALDLTPREGPRLTHEQEQAMKRGV
jgi:putative ATPase